MNTQDKFTKVDDLLNEDMTPDSADENLTENEDLEEDDDYLFMEDENL
jgi:hypothetical protein